MAMYSLTTQMKRLEAVISRLEDIAEAFEKSGNTVSTVESGGSLTGALGNVRSLIAAPPSNAAYAPDATEAPEMLTGPIREFDAFLEKSVGPYVKLSNDLGGSVAAQAAAVLASFHEQRKILVTASRTKKPDASGLQEILQPMENYAAHVVSIQENNPFDSMHKHLSCVADGIPALGWISIEMRAFNHVDKFFGYAQYFGNKVIKEYKGRGATHVEWVQAYYQIFRDLSTLIKEQFPVGIHWFVESKR